MAPNESKPPVSGSMHQLMEGPSYIYKEASNQMRNKFTFSINLLKNI